MSFSPQYVSAIIAMAENRVIGKWNRLPWHLSADLRRFKALTTDHPIIMGRKTFESIGKPLPNRTNIIVTRDPQYHAEGCKVANSLQEALALAGDNKPDEIFIIGGAEIFQQALPLLNRFYLTLVHAEVDGDVYLPPLPDASKWREVEREDHKADEKNDYDFSFVTLER